MDNENEKIVEEFIDAISVVNAALVACFHALDLDEGNFMHDEAMKALHTIFKTCGLPEDQIISLKKWRESKEKPAGDC